jgi:hypothetical protein
MAVQTLYAFKMQWVLMLTGRQCKEDHFGCTATSLRSSWKIEHLSSSMHKKYDQ